MNTRSLCLSLGMLLCLGTGALGKDQPPPHTGGNPDRGMFIFNTYCSACHGDEGKGDGPMAPRLARDFHALPTDLSNPAWQKARDDKALTKIIREGGKSAHRSQFMPAWGLTLTEQQLTDLVTFIRDLKNTPTGQRPRVSIINIQDRLELGRTLYSIYCVACHGNRGAGDGPLVEAAKAEGHLEKSPPDFNAAAFFKSRNDDDLQRWAESGPAHAKMGLTINDSKWWHRPLSQRELDSLTLFLRAQSLVHQKQ